MGSEENSALSGGWWSVLYPLGGSRNAFVGRESRSVARRLGRLGRDRASHVIVSEGWSQKAREDVDGQRGKE